MLGSMTTLAEIESAVRDLPRPEKIQLLHFVEGQLQGENQLVLPKTGAELARLWPTRCHLDAEDATAFERELAEGRASESLQAPPSWE
jgi:hypothetical protein